MRARHCTLARGGFAVAVAVTMSGTGCSTSTPASAPSAPTVSVTSLPGHGELAVDTTPKEPPRLLPPEAYIRSYLSLFGGLSPAAAQLAAKATDGNQLFDNWNDYLASLGLPDYRIDSPRSTQTNTLMLATFERLGNVLCDRAVEHDIQHPGALSSRLLFAFDVPAPPSGKFVIDASAFAPGFDVLHRTFLGYPSSLAPPDRLPRFYKLYADTVAAHAQVKGSRLKPSEAGWATVCYGLVRHPEFHLY